MKKNKLFVVHWKSKLTGKTGFGLPMTETAADKWAWMGNCEFSDIEHFVKKMA